MDVEGCRSRHIDRWEGISQDKGSPDHIQDTSVKERNGKKCGFRRE